MPITPHHLKCGQITELKRNAMKTEPMNCTQFSPQILAGSPAKDLASLSLYSS